MGLFCCRTENPASACENSRIESVKLDSDSLAAMLKPVVEGLGYRLWGIEFRSSQHHALVKLYIDHDQGISVDDCADVSQQVSALLDVEDPINVGYTLEVSSPGIERPLMELAHYREYIGHDIKLRLSWAIEQRKNFLGTLVGVGDDKIRLEVDGETFELPVNAIKRANLIYKEVN